MNIPTPQEVTVTKFETKASGEAYIAAFVEACRHARAGRYGTEVWVKWTYLTAGADRDSEIAGRVAVEARGWQLTRIEPTGLRDASRYDVWTPS